MVVLNFVLCTLMEIAHFLCSRLLLSTCTGVAVYLSPRPYERPLMVRMYSVRTTRMLVCLLLTNCVRRRRSVNEHKLISLSNQANVLVHHLETSSPYAWFSIAIITLVLVHIYSSCPHLTSSCHIPRTECG